MDEYSAYIIALEEDMDVEPGERKQAVREFRIQRSQNWFYTGRWKDTHPESQHHLQSAGFGHLATDMSTSSRRNWARKK